MKKNMLLLFIFNLTFLFAENWNYKLETIELPVGNSESEIYICDAPDDLPDIFDEGPTQFQVDESGNIYAHTENRIKKFNETGSFICASQPSKSVLKSFKYNDKMIYITQLDHQKIVSLLRLNANLNLIDSFDIVQKNSMLYTNQNGKIGWKTGNNKFSELVIQNSEILVTKAKYLNKAVLDFKLREGKQQVLVLGENIEIDLNEIWPNEMGHSFIGFDENGNLYFNIYSKPLGDSNLGIISQSGEIITTNITFTHYAKYGLELISGIPNYIKQDGVVYQMIPMKDKVEIKKWMRLE